MIGKPNTLPEFIESLKESAPSANWPEPLQALWWDARGNWQKAHQLADGLNTAKGSWVHAYLHRKEGDERNAGYWYRMAAKPFPAIGLDEEFEELVLALLESHEP